MSTKVYNKFVESKKEPSNKSDIWFDGSSWNMYKEGMWRPFTISLEQAQALYRYVEGFKLFKIVDSLPQIGQDNTIYLVESKDSIKGNNLVEYIYINNTWEEIGNFTPTLELDDYLKISDSPFEKGAVKNTAVLKSNSRNYTFGEASVAIGSSTKARTSNSFTSGLRTEVYCPNGAAFGQDNVGNRDAIFEVGVGTSTKSKNAFEVKQNGDVYITGIGGFTGVNSNSSKSVQEVINELINKLNEITTND